MGASKITPTQALRLFGQPGDPKAESKYMTRWAVPEDIQSALRHVRFTAMGTIGFPKAIYMNKMLQKPLEAALRCLISKGLASELKTWDGCYIVRNSRGSNVWSLHAWGLAIDVNAATNRLGQKPTLSSGFVSCFTENGFNWGGRFRNMPDGMHFELASLNGKLL